MPKISKPEQLTYVICRDDQQGDIKAYIIIDTDQEMVTPHAIVETYLDKAQWEAKLAEEGITNQWGN